MERAKVVCLFLFIIVSNPPWQCLTPGPRNYSFLIPRNVGDFGTKSMPIDPVAILPHRIWHYVLCFCTTEQFEGLREIETTSDFFKGCTDIKKDLLTIFKLSGCAVPSSTMLSLSRIRRRSFDWLRVFEHNSLGDWKMLRYFSTELILAEARRKVVVRDWEQQILVQYSILHDGCQVRIDAAAMGLPTWLYRSTALECQYTFDYIHEADVEIDVVHFSKVGDVIPFVQATGTVEEPAVENWRSLRSQHREVRRSSATGKFAPAHTSVLSFVAQGGWAAMTKIRAKFVFDEAHLESLVEEEAAVI